jgi:hypothetical protein
MAVTTLSPQKTYRRIIQLELNEISREVVDALVAQGKLPNFAKINQQWGFMKTTSETEYKYLEPWIQWCTAHTGKTYAEHKIFHLSDVHALEHTQIWEALSQAGIESGIIGSMNAIRRDTQGGIFFPDPWAQQNETYPESLRPLWDLIASRVQGHATTKLTMGDILKGAKICMGLGLPLSLYFRIAGQLVSQKLNPKNKWKLAAVFDLFLTEIFKSVLRTTDYRYYTLFLNANAHYQHHYWRAFDGTKFDPSIKYPDIEDSHDPMTYGYEMYDRILGEVFDAVGNDPDTLIVIASGLSQVPYTDKEDQGGMNYYRLNDHRAFADMLGLQSFEIFPMMSRDWQIKYGSEADRLRLRDILSGLKIQGEPLFALDEHQPGYIFVETHYTKGVKSDAQITDRNGKALGGFYEHFTNTAIKSGHHTGIGNLWLSDRSLVPEQGAKIPLTFLYDFTQEALGAAQMAH